VYVKSIERDLEAGQPNLARHKGAARPPLSSGGPVPRTVVRNGDPGAVLLESQRNNALGSQ